MPTKNPFPPKVEQSAWLCWGKEVLDVASVLVAT
jgi:hypothetical protein